METTKKKQVIEQYANIVITRDELKKNLSVILEKIYAPFLNSLDKPEYLLFMGESIKSEVDKEYNEIKNFISNFDN